MSNGRALGPSPGDNRNLILFIAIAAAILLAWEFFYAAPMGARNAAERARVEAQQVQQAQTPGAATPAAAPVLVTREQALAQTQAARVPIRSAAVSGSIQLQGARFDDLQLLGYQETIDRNSPHVSLLEPNNSLHGYDTFFGWEDQTGQGGLGADDVWTAPAGAALTPETPLVLTHNAGGLEVTRTISLDRNYMFTSHDVVRNAGTAPRMLRPFGVVRREGMPVGFVGSSAVLQGFVGAFGPKTLLHTTSYQDAQKHARERDEGKVGDAQRIVEEQGPGGWLGISDHYWLTALIVDHNETVSAFYDSRNQPGGATDFRAAYRGQWRTLAPGQSVEFTQRLFAGAKRVDLLQDYEHGRPPSAPNARPGTATPGAPAPPPATAALDDARPIPHFDKAVDWGTLTEPLTRPFFWLLDWLAKFAGPFAGKYAFGVGILLTTIVVRILFFPIMYNTSKSMAKMRVVAPKMKEIQERYAADPQRQQQEMIKLYKTEKINPITGCLPMFLQIPIFFGLYKTLSVTIEMRQAPFFGWVHDLSAPDPAMPLNLFGLLPYDPHTVPLIGGILGIGLWPILYGLSMTTQQALSPPPADAMQARIFKLMPVLFTFMLASLPSGLLIYYTWSYTLLMLQQYAIFRRQGVETPFDQFIAKRFKRAVSPAE